MNDSNKKKIKKNKKKMGGVVCPFLGLAGVAFQVTQEIIDVLCQTHHVHLLHAVHVCIDFDFVTSKIRLVDMTASEIRYDIKTVT